MSKQIQEIVYVNDYEFFRAYDNTGIGHDNAASGAGSEKPRLPMVPWVLVQFRTAAVHSNSQANALLNGRINGSAYNIENDSRWTTVSFRVNNDNVNPENDLYADIKRESSAEAKGSMLFDNFFENLQIEDNGGMLKCNLRLFDREFSRLESILMQTMIAMKASNQAYDNRNDLDQYMVQFNMGGPQSVNFRLRFGYADHVPNGEEFIDEANDYSEKFKNRAKRINNDAPKKMVMRSPWYYFQMMGCKFIASEGGLAAQIEGISMGTSMFERLKLLQRFSIMKGTPKNLLTELGRQFFIASQGKIQIVDNGGNIIVPKDIPDNLKYLTTNIDKDYASEWGKTWEVFNEEQMKQQYPDAARLATAKEVEANMYRVEIQYGSEPKPPVDSHGRVIEGRGYIQDYMSVKSLLQQICAKVPPIYSYENDKDFFIIDNEKDVQTIFTSQSDTVRLTGSGLSGTFQRTAFKPIPYSFIVREMEIKSGNKTDRVVRIKFFYRKPALREQEYVRRYIWRNSPNNLFTQFSVMSDLDFATMNQNVVMKEGNGIATVLGVTAQSNTDVSNNATAAAKALPQNILREQFERGLMLVHKIEDSDNTSANEALATANSMIMNMNNQSFKGTIEIPGDPFFYFSDNIQPYQYGIYIDVQRDRNIYWQGLDGKLEKSYLSGFYLISRISHLINSTGFKTNLEIMKWPTQTIKLKERT
jgi:hypothetical protein